MILNAQCGQESRGVVLIGLTEEVLNNNEVHHLSRKVVS